MPPQNLNEQLLHELGKQIVNGDFVPGDVLPKVEALSELKGVSRTVVREALKGLTARRLVESSTKIGTVVRSRADWQWWDPDVLAWASEADDNQEFLRQLTEVRFTIEPAVAELAAKNASEQDIEQIKSSYYQLELHSGNEKEWAKADYEFHHSILLASHNELMISLGNTLHNALVESRKVTIPRLLKRYENSTKKELFQEVLLHKSVMEAICSRDSDLARQSMYEALTHVAKLIEKTEV